uniref:Uncharacterized protein n=1 Tax=Rhizophora mucronata TaxID=61149 RepID=A0A2P2PZW6_RHIMU
MHEQAMSHNKEIILLKHR